MQYKTIVLELLKQRTKLHEQLRLTRRLLPTMETLARDLRESHESWKESLSQSQPGSEPSQISSEAMELALKDMEDRVRFASLRNDRELPTLDKAMAFLVSHTSRD